MDSTKKFIAAVCIKVLLIIGVIILYVIVCKRSLNLATSLWKSERTKASIKPIYVTIEDVKEILKYCPLEYPYADYRIFKKAETHWYTVGVHQDQKVFIFRGKIKYEIDLSNVNENSFLINHEKKLIEVYLPQMTVKFINDSYSSEQQLIENSFWVDSSDEQVIQFEFDSLNEITQEIKNKYKQPKYIEQAEQVVKSDLEKLFNCFLDGYSTVIYWS